MSRRASAVRGSILFFACVAIVFTFSRLYAATPPAPVTRLDLHAGWQLQSACVLQGSSTGPSGLKNTSSPGLDGEILSSQLYRPIGWISTTVPNTIVAAQVAAGIIKDPFLA